MLIVDMSFRTKEAVLKLNADDYTTPLPSFANMNISVLTSILKKRPLDERGTQNDEDFEDYFDVQRIVVLEGLALQFASDNLRGEREIVEPAVRQNGLALQFASDAFKKDGWIVIDAMKQNFQALKYAADELKSDRHFILKAIHYVPHAGVRYIMNGLENEVAVGLELIGRVLQRLEVLFHGIDHDPSILLERIGRELQR